jgi:hypothetical protein
MASSRTRRLGAVACRPSVSVCSRKARSLIIVWVSVGLSTLPSRRSADRLLVTKICAKRRIVKTA